MSERYVEREREVPGMRSLITNMWGRGRTVQASEFLGIFVRHARPFSPLMFMAQEPQIPSRHDLHWQELDATYLLNTKVGSCSFLILKRASSTMVPQLHFNTPYLKRTRSCRQHISHNEACYLSHYRNGRWRKSCSSSTN